MNSPIPSYEEQPKRLTRRPRRMRLHPGLRSLMRETTLRKEDLIMPVFVRPGTGIENPISSMPGISQFSIDQATKTLETYLNAGIRTIMLFGIPETKDAKGSDALSEEGIVARSLRAFKKNFPELVIITDCCFCEYTDHGHCGILTEKRESHPRQPITVDNDRTLTLLGEQAIVQAAAGSDVIAPSGMLDGMVGAIRRRLDHEGVLDIPIMSYAVKYASAFYGPFREAAESHMSFGDRRTYQMDPANAREALCEIALDEKEGADILMLKPALPYLDILSEMRAHTSLPLAAYQVSGEYAMLKAAVEKGWIPPENELIAVAETLTSIKRAGAKMIVTYFAYEMASRYL